MSSNSTVSVVDENFVDENVTANKFACEYKVVSPQSRSVLKDLITSNVIALSPLSVKVISVLLPLTHYCLLCGLPATCYLFVTGRNAGIKITFVSLFLVPTPRRGDSMHRLSSNMARMRRPPTPYLLPKLKIFGGHLGNFGPKERQKRLNNLENAMKNFYFRPVSTNPLVRNLILLNGLHLYFNFGKIPFINDGFITKKNFGTKKPRNLFLTPSAKTRDRIQK